MSVTSLLVRALERTCVLLERSAEDGWSNLTPAEAAKNLRDAIGALARGQAVDYRSLGVEFAPTGPIQEIAMANGWHEEYLQLARVVDRHIDR
jgi:hypothetical protein